MMHWEEEKDEQNPAAVKEKEYAGRTRKGADGMEQS